MLISTNKVYYIIKALVACKEHLMILLKGDFSKNAYDLNLLRYENGPKMITANIYKADKTK